MRISFFCDTFLSFLAQKERKVSKKTRLLFYTFISFLLDCVGKRKEKKRSKEKKTDAGLQQGHTAPVAPVILKVCS